MIKILQKLSKQSAEFRVASVRPFLFPVPDSEFRYRGIGAMEKVRANTILLKIPEKLLITPKDAFRRLEDVATSEILRGLSLVTLFTLLVIHEVRLGKDSQLVEYVETLPASFLEHSLNLTPCQMQTLPKNVRKFLDDQLQGMNAGYQALSCHDSLRWVQFEEFKFAWLAVNTRTVFYEPEEGGRESALAPFLDLFNHSPTPNTVTFFDKKARCYVIQSAVAISPFEQVFISYGNHSNHQLWLDYGFASAQSNPFDFLPLEMNLLVEENVWLLEIMRDKRKWSLVEQYKLTQELCLLHAELSPNLCLLVQISLWNPELSHFNFQIDYTNSQFQRIASEIVTTQLHCYESSFDKLSKCQDTPAVLTSITFLSHAIDFMKRLLMSLE